MIPYIPESLNSPRVINVKSAWETLPGVIADILDRFNIRRQKALEFGVELGYSTSALANYFDHVIGVDPFDWVFGDGQDRSAEAVAAGLKDFPNIVLYKELSDSYIKRNMEERYDLINIDIGYETHCYNTTFPSAEWAVQHSDCVLFHDIFSFPEINQVCEELSDKYGFDYYGYSEPMGPAGVICGLGILIKRR